MIQERANLACGPHLCDCSSCCGSQPGVDCGSKLSILLCWNHPGGRCLQGTKKILLLLSLTKWMTFWIVKTDVVSLVYKNVKWIFKLRKGIKVKKSRSQETREQESEDQMWNGVSDKQPLNSPRRFSKLLYSRSNSFLNQSQGARSLVHNKCL